MVPANAGDEDPLRIRLVENPGQWTARDRKLGVSVQGESRAVALANLDAVVEAITDDGGHEPTDAELRELGVDPATVRTQGEGLPDVLE